MSGSGRSRHGGTARPVSPPYRCVRGKSLTASAASLRGCHAVTARPCPRDSRELGDARLEVRTCRTREGKSRAGRAFRLAAWSLIRSKGYLGAYLRRQRARPGAPKAITAAAHKLARIVYHLVRYGVASVKKTEEAYAEGVRERLERQLRRRAKELGFELTPVGDPPLAPAPA